MKLYKLHTNERPAGYVVKARSEQSLRESMLEYVASKRAAGVALGDVIFCWTPIVPESV